MTRSDLLRRYADMVEMCEGTNVDPDNCVKGVNGGFLDYTFKAPPKIYVFARGVVEGRPVFDNDALYYNGVLFKVNMDIIGINPVGWSWEPPKKRTFVLNGKELPSPKKMPTNYGFILSTEKYYFETPAETLTVLGALKTLLNNAT